jgi:hypothetical protein
MSWSQTAAHNDSVSFNQSRANHVNNSLMIVPHFDLQQRVNSVRSQLFANPRRIGVNNLTKQ